MPERDIYSERRALQADHQLTINVVGRPILNVSLGSDSVIILAYVDSSLLLTHLLEVDTLFNMAKLALPFVLAAVSSMAAGIIVPGSNALESRFTGQSKAVIVQMFEWTWDSIASECTNFLGPAGYGYVQSPLYTFSLGMIHIINTSLYTLASPPQEHVTGSQWWTDYQPVSYVLTSKRGNRSQFANMINTCHKAGIKVIAGAYILSC